MKILFALILLCLSIISFGQDPQLKPETISTQSTIESATLEPVYAPSRETGVVAIRIPFSLIKRAFELSDEQFSEIAGDSTVGIAYDYRYRVTNSRGFKIQVAGVAVYKRSKDSKDRESVWVYLSEAVSEMPSVSMWLIGKTVEIVKAGPIDGNFDPASVGTPANFRLLGFQPAAQLIGGGTAAAYQVAIDFALGNRGRLSGIGSTSFLDQQAQFKLGYSAPIFGDTQIDFLTNQLGTNQTFQIGKESVSRSNGGSIAKNYLSQVAPLSTTRTGIYYAKQLRIDPRVGGQNSRLGSGAYIATTSTTEAGFSADGFTKFSVGTGLYLFPFGADRQFGTRFCEFTYDVGFQIPIQKPRRLKSGYSNDGIWLKLGYFGGIQPGNAFNQVQGFRFDIVRSF
jgi:hypothetical protein